MQQPWWFHIPAIAWAGWVFIVGLMVGSFLNVLIARLPFEKSIVWPGSRCFNCFRPIRFFDNLPIIGYLRLRGRCRDCGVPFSARYLWVELGTGLAFLGLFIFEVLIDWHRLPKVKFEAVGGSPIPSPAAIGLFLYHACLVSLLIAAAVVDAEHRIIPPLIPYTGAVIGLIGAALMPWPWPYDVAAAAVTPAPPNVLPPEAPWNMQELWGRIPIGAQPWPFWGPIPEWAPAPGTWKMGLLNALIGALAGTLVVRWVKWLFEVGFGREALGLGDADLLMMAGAFLGWQVAVLSLFVGAFVALILRVPGLIAGIVRKTEIGSELSFGPGLAIGVAVTWLTWPWLGTRVQFVFMDIPTLGIVVVVLSVGMLSAGLLLRRGADETAEQPAGA